MFMKEIKTIIINLPYNYKIPEIILENNANDNANILTLGIQTRELQEEFIRKHDSNDKIKKILEEKDKFEIETNDKIQKMLKEKNKLESEIKEYKDDLNKLKKEKTNEYNEGREEGIKLAKSDYEKMIKYLETTVDIERKRYDEMKSMIETLRKENITSQEKINDLLSKFKVSSQIGEIGEFIVEDYIKEHLITINSNTDIKNVSSKEGQGDLEYINNNLKLLIEVKNVAVMTEKDIKKFYNNVEERRRRGEINAGLLISLRDTYLIDKRKGLVYELYKMKINNKSIEVPIIFISNVLNQHSLIKVSINFLSDIIEKMCILKENDKEENKDKKERNLLINSIQDIYTYIQQLKKKNENSKKQIKILEEDIKENEQKLLSIDNNLNRTAEEVKDIKYDNNINIGKSNNKNQYQIHEDIYNKAKNEGIKITSNILKEWGYTERQIKCISIKKINKELDVKTA